MRRISRNFFPGAALAVAFLAIIDARECHADAINSWRGASVSVTAAGQDAANAGPTATASTSGNTTASSLGSFGQPVTIGYSSSASATASGKANQLLRVSTNLSEGTTGVLTAPINPNFPVSAVASWNQDSLTLQGPAEAPLPGSVTLQFKLDISPNASLQLGNGNTLAVQINGQNHVLTSNGDGTITMHSPTSTGGQSPSQTGTFDVALPIHSNGVSDAFSVGLSSSQSVQPITIPVDLPPSSLALSLTGITLPDGSPLSSEGMSATFASGLTLAPRAVPESSTFAIWASITALAVTLSHRHKSTRPRQ